MNLIAAIKSGRPYRRKAWVTFWVDNCGTVNDDPLQGIAFWDCTGKRIAITREDLLADDWEIQEPTITITRAQFFEAYKLAIQEDLSERKLTFFGQTPSLSDIAQTCVGKVARRLGLEEK